MHRAVVVRSESHALLVDDAKLAVAHSQLFGIYVQTVSDEGPTFVIRHLPFSELGHTLAESSPERKHLKAAGVGHGRHIPAGKLVKTPRFLDDVVSGLKIKVVGVSQCYLCFHEVLKIFGFQSLHRRLGAHGHKGRRFDVTVRCMYNTSPGE